MDVAEQINRFQEFFEGYYKGELLENVRKGKESIIIDFSLFSEFSHELAELLLEEPRETLKAAEMAVQNIDLPEEVKRFKVRIKNLPKEHKTLIMNIRSRHLGKLMLIEGTVRQKSDVRPHVTSARFECPQCGNTLTVLQLDSKFKEPHRCGCGRKGQFRLLSKELVDAQGIVLEELTKDLEGGAQPKRINILLKNDLVSPMSEKKSNPGNGVRIIGILEEIPIILRNGTQSTKFDLLITANNLESIDEDYQSIEINDEEKEEILKISKEPLVINKLRDSLAPGVYGHEEIKEALVLQFVGGVSKLRSDGVSTRGDIHVLLIGDPGAGKTSLMRRTAVVAPKSRYVSGKGVSGAGLTASVVKDEFLSGWSLEAGALVLAHKGILMIDELDKMNKEDRSAMHEGLESQTISISKANIQATLHCQTTVLAAANPKFGRFDPTEPIVKQIDLPPALINRFDLIFTVKDIPNEKKDEIMAGFILDMHKDSETKEVAINTDLLRKYLAYAKQTIFPKLTDASIKRLKEYYIKMRSSGKSEEGGQSPVPISPRQLEALIRLSEASARARLSNEVTAEDSNRAIRLVDYCLRQVGIDPTTGNIDIDLIATGIAHSERSKILVVKEIINELEGAIGKEIPVEEVVKLANEKGISRDNVDMILEKLKRSGDIFEPKKGIVSRTY